MRMRLALAFALALALLPITGPTGASDLVVVVSARTAVDQLSQDDVINIFMGRYRRLPGGAAAFPIDQAADDAMKASFYQRLVNKNLNDINAYWSRLVFSGKAAPPLKTSSQAEVFKHLASTPGAIAYLDRVQVDGRFKVVFDFSRHP
jgi:hypothetical protein